MISICDEGEDDFKLIPISLKPCLSGELFSKIIQYPIIIEQYEKIVGVRNRGSKQRLYHQNFSEQERRTIHRWYLQFYRWYFQTGTPNRILIKLNTIELLKRAVHFFATV